MWVSEADERGPSGELGDAAARADSEGFWRRCCWRSGERAMGWASCCKRSDG